MTDTDTQPQADRNARLREGLLYSGEGFGARLSGVMDAIQDAMESDREHGSFVSLMADGDYVQALYHADRDNVRNFGTLVKFAENVRRDLEG